MNKLLEIFQRPFAKAIIEAGGECFVVGGSVRDMFLGKQSKDIDLIVRLIPFDDLFALLTEHGRVDLVGESFGVIKLTIDGEIIDIALPRVDSKIEGAKGHKSIHSQSDHMLTIVDDLGRRDFTFNAMAMDSTGHIIDPFKGMKDIEMEFIRPVSSDTFFDDPLRLLRAVQFAARFGFSIEESTSHEMHEKRHLICDIAPERILEELQKVFDKKGHLYTLVLYLELTGIWESFFGFAIRKPENCATSTTLSEFLFWAIGKPTGIMADFYKDKLKITNDLYNEVKAFDTLFGYELQKMETKFHPIFRALKHSECVLHTEFVNPDLQIPFLDGRFPKALKDLALKGEDFMLMGFQGALIKSAQEVCVIAIFNGEVENDVDSLLKFMLQKKRISG